MSEFAVAGAGTGEVQRLEQPVTAVPGHLAGLGPLVRVATLRGLVLASAVVAGDLLLTRESGFQAVLWAGQVGRMVAAVGLGADGGVFAAGQGLADTSDAALIAAEAAAGGDAAAGDARIDPVLIVLNRHEIILAEGLWTESHSPAQLARAMQPGGGHDLQQALAALWQDDRPARPWTPTGVARPALRLHGMA